MIIRQNPYKVNIAGTFLETLICGAVFVAFNDYPMHVEPDGLAQYVTTCIVRTNDPIRMGFGVAVQNPHERPSRETGERYAFRRAIDDYLWKLERSFPEAFSRKAARAALWAGLRAAVEQVEEGVR